jgi:2-methylcitrate dehydratase PrpD
MDQRTELQTIMNFCGNLYYHSLPADVIHAAKMRMLDFIGVAFAGYQTKAAQVALRSATWFGNEKKCTILGQEQMKPPLAAAFINATLGSALDYDDGHRAAIGHPGAVIFPVAMAAGEIASRVSGKQFLAAVVAGYEIGIRCGAVMNSCPEKRLFGAGGGCGLFGATTAAAKIFNLTGEAFKNAISIGEAYGPTAQCGGTIFYGAMTKESMGWGAATALVSTFLAREGYTGPKEILVEDEFYDPSSKGMFKTLGEKFEIRGVYVKRFPSCRFTHSPIAATVRIREKYQPKPSTIERIRVETFKKACTMDSQSPSTTEQAQYSIPYTVAVALLSGVIGPSDVADNNLRQPQVVDLMKKVTVAHAPDLEGLFPAKRPARVSVELVDGTVYTEEISLSKGDPEYPLSQAELVDKFELCTAPYLEKELRRKIIDSVFSLENIEDISEIIDLLRHPAKE